MKIGYWGKVKQMVKESDLLLEVVDARFPKKSRNWELERIAQSKGKPIIIVLNKSDLISKRKADFEKNEINLPCVFVSAKKKMGTLKLKEAIGKTLGNKDSKVAIAGYPNTGKSSVLNMLKGKKSAPVASRAGFTKGIQFVRISSKIMLVDSPGVIPLNEYDDTLMALLSAKNPEQIKDIESTGVQIGQVLIESNKEGVEKHYKVKADDGEELVEQVALKRRKMLSGGRPDMNAGARILINDFQTGKIGL